MAVNGEKVVSEGRVVQCEIGIKLYSNGDVEVNGPIQNKVLMYGLLQAAMEVVSEAEPPKSVSSGVSAADAPSKSPN